MFWSFEVQPIWKQITWCASRANTDHTRSAASSCHLPHDHKGQDMYVTLCPLKVSCTYILNSILCGLRSVTSKSIRLHMMSIKLCKFIVVKCSRIVRDFFEKLTNSWINCSTHIIRLKRKSAQAMNVNMICTRVKKFIQMVRTSGWRCILYTREHVFQTCVETSLLSSSKR